MKACSALAVAVFVVGTMVAQAPTPNLPFNAAGPNGAAPVQNAPYSAEMVTTYDRVLPSGERLHGETHGKVYRDSQGRTRSESDAVGPAAAAQKFIFIFINDPVDHTIISLDPRTLTARVNPSLSPPALGTPRPANPAIAAKLTPVAPGAPLPSAGSSGAYAPSGVPAASANSEDLGTREMEGLTVTGTKVTRTVAAPFARDGQPKSSVTTTWFSPELQVAVLTETDDPQGGHRATKLVNIVRTEPDATLFQIPSGYTVADIRPK